MTPIELAKILCEKKGIDFDKTFAAHLQNPAATVVVRPRCFAMGRAVEIEGKIAWHITMVVGDLRELLLLLPCKLPFISFTRHKGHNRPRLYPADRFLRLCLSTSQPRN